MVCDGINLALNRLKKESRNTRTCDGKSIEFEVSAYIVKTNVCGDFFEKLY